MRVGHAIWSLTVWAVFVVLPLGYLVECTYKPQLLLNDTTRHLYQYRDLRARNDGPSLIPGLFRGGEARADVEAQLLNAGLQAWGTRYEALPPGSVTMQKFRLSAGAMNIACGSKLFVLIGYDDRDRLNFANVEQGGACL